MPFYPLFLELQDRPCLVIGGGRVAFRKAAALLSCGARVTVVGPALSSGLKRLAAGRKVRWKARRFEARDLNGMGLVIAATDDQRVNEWAAREARRRHLWINVVDQPALCSFILPSVVRRGKLVLAISTGGASPALAKWIRRDLEKRYAGFGRLLDRMAAVRRPVQKEIRGAAARKQLFEKALKAYLREIASALRASQ